MNGCSCCSYIALLSSTPEQVVLQTAVNAPGTTCWKLFASMPSVACCTTSCWNASLCFFHAGCLLSHSFLRYISTRPTLWSSSILYLCALGTSQMCSTKPNRHGQGQPHTCIHHPETYAGFINMDNHATCTHRSTISRQRWKGRRRRHLILMLPEWTLTRLWHRPMPRFRPLGCQCKPRWKSWSSQGKAGSVHATGNLSPVADANFKQIWQHIHASQCGPMYCLGQCCIASFVISIHAHLCHCSAQGKLRQH